MAYAEEFRGALPQPEQSLGMFPQNLSSECSAPGPTNDALYRELWHACAGPLVTIPGEGERVYYFPQGHMEQLEVSMNQGVEQQVPLFNLPSKILCRVMQVQLRAEPDNDEVYAQYTLIPELDQSELSSPDSCPPVPPKPAVRSFCKTLTASDTSTHGGFSVLRNHADECLPPLDKTQQPPTQELVAKDLHGIEWRFKHIYRGQPRRHLLTTGWSVFVSSKRLVAGDAFIFLRGDNGELFVGIRRLLRQQSTMPSSVISSDSMHLGVLATATRAISFQSLFTVYYKPRTSPSGFIIGVNKYLEAMNHRLSVGMRFKMKFEGEDTSERRYTGTIIGVGDVSPGWNDSQWRSLKVQWDESSAIRRPDRVSPWELEPIVSTSPLTTTIQPRNKRARLPNMPMSRERSILGGCKNTTDPSSPYWYSSQTTQTSELNSDTEGESGQSHILWGQKQMDLKNDALGHSPRPSTENWMNHFSNQTESTLLKSPKLLFQDGEFKPERARSIGSAFSSGELQSKWAPSMAGHSQTEGSVEPHSDLNRGCLSGMVTKERKPDSNGYRLFGILIDNNSSHGEDSLPQTGKIPAAIEEHPVQASVNGHSQPADSEDPSRVAIIEGKSSHSSPKDVHKASISTRSCTKVLMQGIGVGRAVDLTKLNGYPDLIKELEERFDIKGELQSPNKKWEVVYMDDEGDMMLVGDDPWAEFCNMVRKIAIYPCEEVKKMANRTRLHCSEEPATPTSEHKTE
ncbi:hypothetical protein AMTRI_Chr01g133660 [Amborella trichopoda]